MATTHLLWSTTLKTIKGDLSKAEPNKQLLKPYLFVLLGSAISDNDPFRKTKEILELNQIDVCVFSQCAKFKRWLKSYESLQK